MVEGVTRRLAAILCADVVGYSRLVEADEEGTIARLKAIRRDVIDPSTERHHGRVVKTTGDGILVEFPSVVDAVRSAVDVQRSVVRGNAEIAEDRCIRLRVGINLGDIIVEGDDILGDGVNVASRLEELADSNGIWVSRAVRDQIGERINIEFVDLGQHQLKNIARPVECFKVRLDEAEAETAIKQRPIAGDASATNQKPSIAVLPFDDMSGDSGHEFFADGLTEDIISELSRFRGLFVISRSSSFVYKDRSFNVQDIAGELNVQYVVEGSVRKAGNRVRITVQLIDAATDTHLWAERYDRDLEDIFAIQDDVITAIVATLPGRIEAATRERTEHKPTENMAAYECVLAGKRLHHRSTPEDNAEAMRMLERAIELDPRYAHAHAWRACTLGQIYANGWGEDPESIGRQVFESLQTALALDDNDNDVHRILAAIYLVFKDHHKAVYHQERALNLNPNDDLVVVQEGEILTWLGRPEEGVDWIKKAMRLTPYHPERFWNHLGRAHFVARQYDRAVDAFNNITEADYVQHSFLAACHAQLDDAARATNHTEKVIAQRPSFSIGQFLEGLHYKNEVDVAHYRESLLKAGLPA